MNRCVFWDKCYNRGDCEFCHYNPEACTQDNFSWNGEGEEPSQEEREMEVCS